MQVDAMLKEIQYDYLSDHIIHVDLIRIDLNKPVNVNVPVVVQGESIGVKVDGGIFDFRKPSLRHADLAAERTLAQALFLAGGFECVCKRANSVNHAR